MKWIFALACLATTVSAFASLTIGTYNIRNFDYDQRYRIHTNKVELAAQLKSLKADVLSVEEINNSQEFERFVATKMVGYGTELTRCGGEHDQHLGFIYNRNTVELLAFNEDLRISAPGQQGTCNSGSRPMAIGLFKVKATGQRFYGMTVHLKSGSNNSSIQKRNKQYEIIRDTIEELKSKTGIQDFYVAGDFNTTEYLARGSDYIELNRVTRNLNMTDMSSNLKCTAYWWGGSDDGIETPSILDHLLVTKGLMKSAPRINIGGHCQKVNCREVPVKELGVSYESVSDHCPLTATM